MNRILSVKDLSPSTMNRARGSQAYRNLLEHFRLEDQPLQIDLREQELISMSFLDELVVNLDAASLLDKVTFLFTAKETYKQLAQISGIRNVRIFYRISETADRREVESRSPSALHVIPRRSGNS